MNRHSFRLSFLVIAALAATGLAHAGGNSNNSDTINNYGGNTTNQGGQGGNGGSGGSAAAIAGAASQAAAVSGSNSSIKSNIENRNTAVQSIESRNTISNRAAGGAASSSSGGNVSNSTMATGATNQGVAVDARNQSVYQAQERDPVNSAYAPHLTTSNGTCMGSTSAGATGPGASISFGTTWKDSDCSLRYTAEALRASGNNAIAQALLCQIPEVKKVAPKHCRAVETALADPVAAMDSKVAEVTAQTSGTSNGANLADPYIAARLAAQGK